MLSVLDQPALRARVSRFSVEEYHRLGENGRGTELIRGIIIEKRSKSSLHGTIASTLQALLMPAIPEGFCWRREEPLSLSDSEPEPDFAIVSGGREDYLRAHPRTAALVLEVAVTSPDADRALAEIYAGAEVAEYWVVLPNERPVEVLRRPENGRYREMRSYGSSEGIECESRAGCAIEPRGALRLPRLVVACIQASAESCFHSRGLG